MCLLSFSMFICNWFPYFVKHCNKLIITITTVIAPNHYSTVVSAAPLHVSSGSVVIIKYTFASFSVRIFDLFTLMLV